MEARIPTVLIILGATGDLMQRKITPALFELYKEKELPIKFHSVGFARRKLADEQFRDILKTFLEAHKYSGAQSGPSADFLKKFSYCAGDLSKLEDYKGLARRIDGIDKEWRVCANKLFYLAIPPELYKVTLENLSKSGLTKPCSPEEGWTRVLVEKPFGKDLKTAKQLDKLLGKLFKEVQIYRIDHYLAKEMVRNILNFRFSNTLFEPLWNSKYIEKVNIRLLETIGVESRGEFYDGLGALRDVGQNHILQMLAFAAMENPGSFEPEAIRTKRAELLAQLRIMPKKSINEYAFRAQCAGYRGIRGVRPDSNTETYFKIKAFVDSPRWQGVPFFLESGKRIKEVKKEIVITLKHSIPCLLCPPGIEEHYKNQISISLEPEEGINVSFWAKKPGTKNILDKRTFDFLLRAKGERKQYVEEYQELLLDAIAGDQISFVSTEEVDSMWRFIDPIVDAWEKNIAPLEVYEPNTYDAVGKAARMENFPKTETERMERSIGIVGLGKMGYGIALRLKEHGWRVAGYDAGKSARKQAASKGIATADNLSKLGETLEGSRVFWLMLPAAAVDDVIFGNTQLAGILRKGDIVIDAGNSFYKDSQRRFEPLKRNGVDFVDVGFSGGPGGARGGASLMIGGEKNTFKKLKPLFQDLSVFGGYQFFEGPGAGHFVKMIHNGIEYGMMQAIAEGFNMLKQSKYKLNLTRAVDVYNNGSVIESRLVGWLKEAFDIYGEGLKNISGSVEHTGEGAWMVKTAKEMKLKVKIIEGALEFRKQSVRHPDYAGKILTALRSRFGGHRIK